MIDVPQVDSETILKLTEEGSETLRVGQEDNVVVFGD